MQGQRAAVSGYDADVECMGKEDQGRFERWLQQQM